MIAVIFVFDCLCVDLFVMVWGGFPYSSHFITYCWGKKNRDPSFLFHLFWDIKTPLWTQQPQTKFYSGLKQNGLSLYLNSKLTLLCAWSEPSQLPWTMSPHRLFAGPLQYRYLPKACTHSESVIAISLGIGMESSIVAFTFYQLGIWHFYLRRSLQVSSPLILKSSHDNLKT